MHMMCVIDINSMLSAQRSTYVIVMTSGNSQGVGERDGQAHRQMREARICNLASCDVLRVQVVSAMRYDELTR